MEFINLTNTEAELIHGPDGPHHHGVAVIAKTTMGLEGGLGASEPEFVWPISRQELKTDYATFPFDHHFPLSKLDMMVCGDACSGRGRTVRDCAVSLTVGELTYEQWILGDRVWQKRGFSYKPSDPVAFSSYPLRLENAFGGKVNLLHGEFTCLENPVGKGFLMKGMEPENQPLPNIERPGERLQDPFAMPRPTCMAPYPLEGKLRYDPLMENGKLPEFDKTHASLYFGQAHPDLQIERVTPGTEIRIKGMHPFQEIAFQVPDFQLHIDLEVDDETLTLPWTLDGICVFAHQFCVGFKFRAATTFPLQPRQVRKVVFKEVSS